MLLANDDLFELWRTEIGLDRYTREGEWATKIGQLDIFDWKDLDGVIEQLDGEIKKRRMRNSYFFINLRLLCFALQKILDLGDLCQQLRIQKLSMENFRSNNLKIYTQSLRII